jgi:dephospho-CoA kinase
MGLVALTDGIACGKTTVAAHLRSRHRCRVVDSDAIVLQLQRPHTRTWRRIVAHFGGLVLNADGTLNRRALGEIVFNSETERECLNAIVHPPGLRTLALSALRFWLLREELLVLEIPLFFEGWLSPRYYHDIVCVAVDHDDQARRLMTRNGLTRDAAESRIAAQMAIEEKCRLATVVLRNDGTEDELKQQVDLLVEKWKTRARFTYLMDPLILAAILVIVIIIKFII